MEEVRGKWARSSYVCVKRLCVFVCAGGGERLCVCMCVCACVRACMRVCVCGGGGGGGGVCGVCVWGTGLLIE